MQWRPGGLLPLPPTHTCPDPRSVLSTSWLPQDLYELAFSVSYDHGEEEAYLNFIAPSKREVSIWGRLSQFGRAGQGKRWEALTGWPRPSSTCGQMG